MVFPKKVYRIKIRDVAHLRERLGAAWAEISKEEIDRIIHLGSDFERVSELVGGVLNIKLNEEKVLTW